jgi:hypothetical protein
MPLTMEIKIKFANGIQKNTDCRSYVRFFTNKPAKFKLTKTQCSLSAHFSTQRKDVTLEKNSICRQLTGTGTGKDELVT